PASEGKVGYWQGTRTDLSAWQFATFRDGDSLSADPLFVDPAGADATIGYDRVGSGNFGDDDDFHVQSTYGSYYDEVWTPQAADSPAIDGGDLADAYAEEPPANGDRINQGAYGNTDQASKSPPVYIQVLSPNGSEKLRVDGGEMILWRSGGAGIWVDIYFTANGDAAEPSRVWTPVAEDVLNDGNFAWNPDTATGAGLIRIVDSADPGITDDSDNLFVIGPAGNDYYINIPDDPNLLDNEYTSTSGDNTNSGTDPAAPMASLRALLAAYDLDPGDTVWVDTGTYDLVATVDIGTQDEGVTIRGPVGVINEAIIDRGNPGFSVIALDNADDVTIRNLTVRGGYHGIYLNNGSSYFTADTVEARNSKQTGIYVADAASDYATITDSVFYGTTGSGNTDQNRGIDLRGHHPTVTDNYFFHTPGSVGDGAYLYDISTAVVTGNHAYNNYTGIYIYGVQFTLSGNFAHDNNTGLSLYDTDSALYSPVHGNEVYDNTLTGIFSNGYEDIYDNDVHDNSGTGISTSSARWRTVRDNDSYDNVDGIRILKGLVADNRVWGNSNAGIYATNYGSLIEGNVSYGNAYGVYVSTDWENVTVRNNLIYNNSTRGIEINNAMLYGTGVDVVNNTVYEPAADAVYVTNSSKHAHLRNNILWADGGYELYVADNSQTGFTSEANLFYGQAGDFLYWQQDFASLVDWFLELGLD
ncbi:hypothetical protein LCGC14_2068690, partial [marine sediment metagenome]